METTEIFLLRAVCESMYGKLLVCRCGPASEVQRQTNSLPYIQLKTDLVT